MCLIANCFIYTNIFKSYFFYSLVHVMKARSNARFALNTEYVQIVYNCINTYIAPDKKCFNAKCTLIEYTRVNLFASSCIRFNQIKQ